MDEITIKDILDCVGENINPAKDILGSEAEMANTVEYHLSRNYFQNLGVIMREYLSTTSLGDLVRKSKETEIQDAINAGQNRINANIEASNQINSQPITEDNPRKPFGEINQ